jgi:hypothetical protein
MINQEQNHLRQHDPSYVTPKTILKHFCQTKVTESTHKAESEQHQEDDCNVTKDLWAAAVEKLDEKSKSRLILDKTDPTEDKGVVDAVELSLWQITQQREEHGEKCWKYKDKTTQMLQLVMNFKGLVDAGLKFDPTGYGKSFVTDSHYACLMLMTLTGMIAWTVISSGLQVC